MNSHRQFPVKQRKEINNVKKLICNPPDLLLLEDDLIKEELQRFIGIVDAQLLKAVYL